MSFFHSTGVHFDDASQIDAFGRLRSSSPVTLFEAKQLYDSLPMMFDDSQTSGAGTSSTFNTNQSSTTIAVSNTTAGVRVRQSFQRINYQPGKSQASMHTFVLGAGGTGIIKRIGNYTANNGIFLERNGATAVNLVVRTNTSGSPSDSNAVAQTAWNIDRFDNSGPTTNPSGITIDWTKTQLMFIDFAWLGVSRVRVGFVIGGILYYAHQFKSANIDTLVYMANPNLPVRMEIQNTGAGGVASLTHICSTVISEGGSDHPGMHRSVDTGNTALTTLNNSNIFPLVAVRLNTTRLRGVILPHHISAMCTTAAAFRYVFLLNPTVTGTAFSWNTITNSVAQYATPTNATTISGGIQITSGYGPGGANSVAVIEEIGHLALGSNIAGTPDVMALGIQRLSASAETFHGLIHFEEQV